MRWECGFGTFAREYRNSILGVFTQGFENERAEVATSLIYSSGIVKWEGTSRIDCDPRRQ